MSCSRREFTGKAFVAGAISTLPSQLFAADNSAMPIIDTHQHLWDLEQFQPPWLDGADAKIAARHDSADYTAETQGLNIVKTVYMEVDVAPADQVKEAEYVLSLIQAGNSPMVGAVISGRPNSENFAHYMTKFKDDERIKGVRQVLHPESAQPGLCLQPQFVRSIQLLGEMGKSFDLCMRPTELADGAQLAKMCPQTQFIVDHCGNADPQAWRAKDKQTVKPIHEVDTWKRDIEKLARCDNVACKISGIIARAPRDWTPNDLAPAINFCLDTFGSDRVVFGGDWPVCKLGASFADWVKALKQVVSNRATADQRKLFHDNAQRVYRV
jgi:predicted TIM-barrel fold metal-dependent hydrolase